MRNRRLALRKETLTELGPDQLVSVAGADVAPTSPLVYCASELVRVCESFLRTCVTYTCTR